MHYPHIRWAYRLGDMHWRPPITNGFRFMGLSTEGMHQCVLLSNYEKVWDLNSKECIATLSGHSAGINDLDIHPYALVRLYICNLFAGVGTIL